MIQEKRSKYPDFIKTLLELEEILKSDKSVTALICVQSLGRSPKMAHDLTKMGFRAYAVKDGLKGVVENGNLGEVARVLAIPWMVVAAIKPHEQQTYGSVLRRIDRFRTRGVVVGEILADVLERLRQAVGKNVL